MGRTTNSMRHLKGTIKTVTSVMLPNCRWSVFQECQVRSVFCSVSSRYSSLAAKLGHGIIMAYGSFAFLQLLITKSPKIPSTYCKQTCGGCWCINTWLRCSTTATSTHYTSGMFGGRFVPFTFASTWPECVSLLLAAAFLKIFLAMEKATLQFVLYIFIWVI